MAMEEGERGRKKVAQTAISALCLEAGFISVEKRALETLGHLLECYVDHVGKKAKSYCEIASRTVPTYSDAELALVDVGVMQQDNRQVALGADISSLSEHARRPQRRHLPKQVRSYPPPQRRVLQVGTKKSRPSHIGDHLPAFPDPHTYIRTPTFSPPSSDYRWVREKLATQKRNSRKGLSKLLAKTRPSHPIAGATDKCGIYSVVTCPSPSSPLYLHALMPTPEDEVDTVTTEKVASEKPSPAPGTKLNTASKTDEDFHTDDLKEALSVQELYENPFQKPPKRIRLKLL